MQFDKPENASTQEERDEILARKRYWAPSNTIEQIHQYCMQSRKEYLVENGYSFSIEKVFYEVDMKFR